MPRKRMKLSLQEVPEYLAIAGVDGLEIDHHGKSEDRIVSQLSKTSVDRFVDHIRGQQEATFARVTDSEEFF